MGDVDNIDCQSVQNSVDLLLDGELDAVDELEVRAHVRGCRHCSGVLRERQETKARLRAMSGSFSAPSMFKDRLRSSIRERAAARTRHHRRRLLSVGAGLALVAGVVLVAAVSLRAPSPAVAGDEGVVAGLSEVRSPVVAESVDWHRRNVPVEVTGPHAESVGNWFSDKLPFRVRIPELGREGNLLGARLSNIQQHDAAYVVYEVSGSKLSVMVFDAVNFPIEGFGDMRSDAPRMLIDNASGFNVAVVRDGHLGYTFTSELSEDRLRRLVEIGMAPR